MSHVKFNSLITQTTRDEKIVLAKVETFSDVVTDILRREAASKMKKLMYVFVHVTQKGPASFTCAIDDSRDKISPSGRGLIETKFSEIFEPENVV